MKKYLKFTIPFIVLGLFAILLLKQGTPWQDFKTVLRQARWEWLLLALVWQAASYGAVTWLNQIILRHYGADVPWGKQYIIQLAMAFVEAAIPSAAISGAVLRVRLLKPHGVSAAVATVSTVIEVALVSVSVLLLALPALILVTFSGMPGKMGLWQGLVGLGVITFLMTVVISIKANPRFIQLKREMQRWMIGVWDQHFYARWRRYLGDWSGQRILNRLHYFGTESMALLRAQPYTIGINLLARSVFEALGLMMCFYALGQYLPWPTMILIYTLTIAVNSLGAIPGGIGLAEVSLAVLYTQFGIPVQTAVVIALAYRLTDYWLPRLAGGVAWFWLEQKFPVPISEEVA